MTDLFKEKNVKPMLIGAEGEAFDSPDYIFELKLDGERCIAYLGGDSTELINKRGQRMLPKTPELNGIHRHVSDRCVLDGELAVIKNGRPDFFEIQRRSLMSNPFKIQLAASKHPACFTAFDILYIDGELVTDRPLMERKELLAGVVKSESGHFAVSRYISQQGVSFYELARKQNLEGIVAKRCDSKYYFGKRTKDWIKIKNLKDDDFVICGYILKEKHVISIVLGQYRNGTMLYKGHVTLGVNGGAFRQISAVERREAPPFAAPPGNERAVWIEPRLVCTVKYMELTNSGGLRQPVFKGLRNDKAPEECVEPISKF